MSDGFGWRARVPLRVIPATPWVRQPPTWHVAKPTIIEAALEHALARPSGNWYVLAASREIRPHQPFGRAVAGIDLVAWRTRAGVLHVAPGTCPHLGGPLSLASVDGDRLVCRWHGLALGPEGFPGWSPYPAYDDGVLAWVRLDAVGDEEPTPRPVVPERPATAASIDAVATMVGHCEPEDVIANRLDPWHGAWFHPYFFAGLRVLEAPGVDDPAGDFTVDVTFRVAGRLGVPVTATFGCPEPRTVIMRIVDGEGTGSVVETHAVPLGTDARGQPRTAVIEATVAHSGRRGFALARRLAPAVRPLIRLAARRLWADDLAYAERRYQLRSTHRWPAARQSSTSA